MQLLQRASPLQSGVHANSAPFLAMRCIVSAVSASSLLGSAVALSVVGPRVVNQICNEIKESSDLSVPANQTLETKLNLVQKLLQNFLQFSLHFLCSKATEKSRLFIQTLASKLSAQFNCTDKKLAFNLSLLAEVGGSSHTPSTLILSPDEHFQRLLLLRPEGWEITVECMILKSLLAGDSTLLIKSVPLDALSPLLEKAVLHHLRTASGDPTRDADILRRLAYATLSRYPQDFAPKDLDGFVQSVCASAMQRRNSWLPEEDTWSSMLSCLLARRQGGETEMRDCLSAVWRACPGAVRRVVSGAGDVAILAVLPGEVTSALSKELGVFAEGDFVSVVWRSAIPLSTFVALLRMRKSNSDLSRVCKDLIGADLTDLDLLRTLACLVAFAASDRSDTNDQSESSDPRLVDLAVALSCPVQVSESLEVRLAPELLGSHSFAADYRPELLHVCQHLISRVSDLTLKAIYTSLTSTPTDASQMCSLMLLSPEPNLAYLLLAQAHPLIQLSETKVCVSRVLEWARSQGLCAREEPEAKVPEINRLVWAHCCLGLLQRLAEWKALTPAGEDRLEFLKDSALPLVSAMTTGGSFGKEWQTSSRGFRSLVGLFSITANSVMSEIKSEIQNLQKIEDQQKDDED